jgi:hypothetical protein
MSRIQDLTGAIKAPETPKDAKKRREQEAVARDRKKLARARKIRSRYGAGTFGEKQALGKLQPFQLQIHGGVKLGSLEPMSVDLPSGPFGNEQLALPFTRTTISAL